MLDYFTISEPGLVSLSSTVVESNGFDDVHTSSNPYCGDFSCWCHSDASYHRLAVQPVALAVDAATIADFFGLEAGA